MASSRTSTMDLTTTNAAIVFKQRGIKLSKREHSLLEILQSESRYINKLRVLQNSFLEPLDEVLHADTLSLSDRVSNITLGSFNEYTRPHLDTAEYEAALLGLSQLKSNERKQLRKAGEGITAILQLNEMLYKSLYQVMKNWKRPGRVYIFIMNFKFYLFFV